MKREVSFTFTLLAASILLTATGQAQHGGAATHGGSSSHPVVATRSAAGHGGSQNGLTNHSGAGDLHGKSHDHSRNRNLGSGSVLYPVGYDESYDGEEPGPPDESGTPLMPVPGGHSRPAARRIPSGPKITELPGASKAATTAPLPPAMFILTNGEHIETQQYLVTYDHVELTVDHQSRTLPLAMLDVNATLAADRKRGIDLRIPAGQNEISLGF